MEKKRWEERRKKKIVLPKESEPEKKDYRRWAKYIIAGFFIVFFFIFLRGKKEEIEIPKPETAKPAAPVGQGSEVGKTGVSDQWSVSSPAIEPPPLPKKNIPPEVLSIKLTPKLVYPGTMIKAEIEGKDADDDPVTFNREWKKNDEVLAGETMDDLDTKGFKKGELITLYVTPFDGKEKGKRKWSPTIMIANRPPEITSSPPTAVANRYTYEVRASDPDGDKLTYSLEGAPPGMTIDPATGRIEWNVPSVSELKSDVVYNLKVIASDGDATAFQGFNLSLKKEFR